MLKTALTKFFTAMIMPKTITHGGKWHHSLVRTVFLKLLHAIDSLSQ